MNEKYIPKSKVFIISLVATFILLFTSAFTVKSESTTKLPEGEDTPMVVSNGPSKIVGVSSDDLLDQAQSEEGARVIVRLNVEFTALGELSAEEVDAQIAEIAEAQSNLLNELSSVEVENLTQFEYIPYVAMTVDSDTLSALMESTNVISIEEDVVSELSLTESIPLIDADLAWGYGYTGSDWTIAILDTGVDSDHEFLTDKVVSEACYSGASGYAKSLCPKSTSDDPVYKQIGDGSGENCKVSTYGTQCEHGTHVAGIAAGSGTSFSGVAKDANIISIQVFSYKNGSVVTYMSDWIKGLERVYALSDVYNIAAVNLSFGSEGPYNESCDSTYSAAAEAIENLRSVKIATIAAAGNYAWSNGVSFPACISSAIAVGATNNNDQVDTTYSNSGSLIALWAPGTSITSSIPGTSTYETKSGTSMSAPHVAGAFAIIRSYKNTASVDTILTALKTYGKSITDPRNNITRKRIDIDNTLASFTPGKPVLISPSDVTHEHTRTFTWKVTNFAKYYELYIYNKSTSSVVYDSWIKGSTHCTDTTCSYDVTISPHGTYIWKVRAKTSQSIIGSWSSTMQFGLILPGPTLTSPTSNIDNWLPTYTWTPEAEATTYRLLVYNSAGELVIDEKYNSTDIGCDSGTCSVQPTTSLRAGPYTWKVRSGDTYGGGSYSSKLSFNTPSKPSDAPTLTSPVGTTLSDWDPTFSWESVDGATKYRLYVYKKSGTSTIVAINAWYTLADAGCDSDTTCEIDPNLSLGSGPYYWYVRAGNPSGSGPWSDQGTFATPDKPTDLPVLVNPTGDIDNWSPTFYWTGVERATQYRLLIYKKSGTSTTILERWYTLAEAGCDVDADCEINPGLSLGAGPYYWRVRAGNPSGKSGWSTTNTFNPPAKPAQVETISPNGIVNTATPTFTWTAVNNAASYTLYIYKTSNGSLVHQVAYTPAEVGCDSDATCEYTPAITLSENVNYSWKVRAKNQSGKGVWSAVKSVRYESD